MQKKDKFAQYMSTLSVPSVLIRVDAKSWRIVGRGTLLLALAVSALQYYTLHVYVQVLSLPVLVTMS